MPFKSAELKREYERLQAAGVHITASQAAALFKLGLLATAVEGGIDTKLSRDQAFSLLQTKKNTLEEDQARLQRAQKDLETANHWVDFYQEEYSYYQDKVEQWFVVKRKAASIQRQIEQLTKKINYRADRITDFQETLRRLIRRKPHGAPDVAGAQTRLNNAKAALDNTKYWLSICEGHYGVGALECQNQVYKVHDAQVAYDKAKQALIDAKQGAGAWERKRQQLQNNINIELSEKNTLEDERRKLQAQLMKVTGTLAGIKELERARDIAQSRENYWAGKVIDLEHRVGLLETMVSEDKAAVKHADANWKEANRKWKQWQEAMRSHTG